MIVCMHLRVFVSQVAHRSAHEAAVTVVETVFVLAEFSFWRVRQYLCEWASMCVSKLVIELESGSARRWASGLMLSQFPSAALH